MKVSLTNLGEHVSEMEQRVGANEDNLSNLLTRVEKLENDKLHLMSKVEDLENRSRSLNLRFIRVPEGVEGCDMLDFMARLIPQVLGQDSFPTLPAMERAHRTPTLLQGDKPSPRPILIKLLNFQDKVKILRLAREKKELLFNGSHIFISLLQCRPDEKASLL